MRWTDGDRQHFEVWPLGGNRFHFRIGPQCWDGLHFCIRRLRVRLLVPGHRHRAPTDAGHGLLRVYFPFTPRIVPGPRDVWIGWNGHCWRCAPVWRELGSPARGETAGWAWICGFTRAGGVDWQIATEPAHINKGNLEGKLGDVHHVYMISADAWRKTKRNHCPHSSRGGNECSEPCASHP